MVEQKKVISKLNIEKYETFMLYFGLLNPIFTIPQVIKVYFTHKHLVGGLSLVAFTSYAIVNIGWFTYGLIHERRSLCLANFCSLILNASIVIGIISYSGLSF